MMRPSSFSDERLSVATGRCVDYPKLSSKFADGRQALGSAVVKLSPCTDTGLNVLMVAAMPECVRGSLLLVSSSEGKAAFFLTVPIAHPSYLHAPFQASSNWLLTWRMAKLILTHGGVK